MGRVTSGDIQDAGVQLLIAEYQAVRNEILESFKLTQAIIQWSLAIYGVGFGAGFVALTEATKLTNPTDPSNAFLQWMVAAVFGILLPGLMWAASFHWLGEIRRMERAGSYIRGLEYKFKNAPFRIGSTRIPRPLNWERHLTVRKGWLPYYAVAALFGGTMLVAFGVAVLWVLDVWGFYWWPPLLAGFLFLAYVLWAWLIGRTIRGIGGQRYDFDYGSLVPWDPWTKNDVSDPCDHEALADEPND